MIDWLSDVYVLRLQHFSEPHFLFLPPAKLVCGNIDKVEEQVCTQHLPGEQHPRASVAQILVLSSVVQLFHVN